MTLQTRRDWIAGVPLLLAGCAAPPAPPTPTPAAPPAPRPWTDAPAYSIVRVEIRDGRGFGEYVAGHTPSVAAAGGRFVVAGAMPQAVEGTWPAQRMVIHEWPRPQAFLDWYGSAGYAPWKRLRHSVSSADVVLVQGVAPTPRSPDQAPAFVVIDVGVRDGAAFGRYVQGHMPGLRAAGGQFVVAGGRFEVIEGGWTPRRLVVHHWPSAAAFRGWYESAEYRPWRDVRWSAASADVALVEGLSEKVRAERKLP